MTDIPPQPPPGHLKITSESFVPRHPDAVMTETPALGPGKE